MNKIGLSLGGGGAKGSYQLGVMKALDEYNLLEKINVVSGTSIGAINALMFMAGKSVSEMVEIWNDINNDEIYQSGIQFKQSKYQKLYDITPLFNKLSMSVTTKEIKQSKIDCYVTACKILNDNKKLSQFKFWDMEVRYFHLNTYRLPRKAVLASASIPGLFGKTKIMGKSYVDGGLLDNHPIDPLLKQKCNIIFNVPLDQFFKPNKYHKESIVIIDFSSKHAFHSSLIIDLIDAIRFDNDRIEERFRYGYLVGKKILEKLFNNPVLNNDLTFNIPDKFLMINLSPDEDLEIYNQIRKEFTNDKD